MNLERLDILLAQFSQKKVLVVGDVFLDRRLIADQGLAATSADTGFETHQVAEVRNSPGAAGAVAGHLRALGVNAFAVGVIGDDGEGFELLRRLDGAGVNVDGLVIRTDRFTPTYIRPLLCVRGSALRELNRLDVRNRAPMPAETEDQVIRTLRGLLPRVHGVIVVDHVPEENFGVVTERVRDELAILAQTYGEVAFIAASTRRIGQFANVLIQPNAREAVQAVDAAATWRGDGEPDWELDRDLIESAGARLYRRNGQPVFLNLAGHGMLTFHTEGPTYVPAIPARGQVNATGADDVALAGIAAALCAGASAPEATEAGCLAAGAVVRPNAAAGTTLRKQMLELKREQGNG